MWRNVYLENRVMSADPIELVCILYERAIELVGDARICLECRDVSGRSKAILQALQILTELEGSLNHEVGGQISQNLQRLYKYMGVRLTAANLKQQAEPLVEVERLLKTLADAWEGIRPKAGQAAGIADLTVSPNVWGTIGMEAETVLAGDGWSA